MPPAGGLAKRGKKEALAGRQGLKEDGERLTRPSTRIDDAMPKLVRENNKSTG
jgi:hypothetical protein